MGFAAETAPLCCIISSCGKDGVDGSVKKYSLCNSGLNGALDAAELSESVDALVGHACE